MERNARTRTLIQLGGLLVKSGLIETLKIPLGVDLQNHSIYKHKAYQLVEMMKGWAKIEKENQNTFEKQ